MMYRMGAIAPMARARAAERRMNRLMPLWVALVALMSGLFSAGALAAPPAGAVIGNQASATYTDAGNNVRTTTSNLVETVIEQVYGVDIESNQNQPSAPGSTIYLPHTVTNTGNGADTFNLVAAQVAGGGFSFSGTLVVYADANGDGVPDNFTPITVTPALAAGASYGIIIAAQVPASATSGQQSQLTITTTSQSSGAATDVNTDTVTITNNAVVPVTKALSLQSGPASTELTVTLTYTNNGTSTATNLTLQDVLDARFAYVANSGTWSVTSPTQLTDAADGNESGITYSTAANTVTAVIASVAPGQTGFVRFRVRVPAGTAAGAIPNVADVSYNDGSTTVTGNTNTTTYTVVQTAAVTLTDAGSVDDPTAVGPAGDDDGATNDIVTRDPVSQGATLYFRNVLVNNGNGTDNFDVTFDSSSFPAGTSFQLLRRDGTPMVDSNGNGTPDTGPLAAGASTDVYLRVILPTGATGAGPYNVVKTARSSVNPAITDSVTDRLLAIADSTVDLTNNSSGPAAPGAGAGPETNPVTTVAVNPGEVASFTLVVANTSAVSDSYNLAASAAANFSSGLPAGWTVSFRSGSASGPVITNTGTIAAGATLTVIAQVSVPAGNAPVLAQSVYFRAQSPTSGATDVKHDAVTVNRVIDVSVAPNNNGQGFPGGQVVYPHVLTNNGNVAVDEGALASANDNPLWLSAIYLDNGDGTFDIATDTLVDNISDLGSPLAPGASRNLWVRVSVPSGATEGAANVTTVTVSGVQDVNGNAETNTANNQATDTTTVQSGQVQVVKLQALDAACDGTADSAYVQTLISAEPEQCVAYQITLTNLGTVPVTSVRISDNTPTYTTYLAGSGSVVPASGTLSAPAGGAAGQVTADFATVGSSGAAVLRFAVRIED